MSLFVEAHHRPCNDLDVVVDDDDDGIPIRSWCKYPLQQLLPIDYVHGRRHTQPSTIYTRNFGFRFPIGLSKAGTASNNFCFTSNVAATTSDGGGGRVGDLLSQIISLTRLTRSMIKWRHQVGAHTAAGNRHIKAHGRTPRHSAAHDIKTQQGERGRSGTQQRPKMKDYPTEDSLGKVEISSPFRLMDVLTRRQVRPTCGWATAVDRSTQETKRRKTKLFKRRKNTKNS